jgi:hypothetical protein
MQPQTTSPMIYAIIGGVCGAIVAIFFMSRLIAIRAKTIVNKWATQNGVEIVSGRVRRFPNKGPFNWGTNFRGQIVLFLKVRCGDGEQRACWIRCGNRFGGIWLGNQTEVKWENHEKAV